MKVYEIRGGEVLVGARLTETEDGLLLVLGEDGRGRERVALPIPEGAVVATPPLLVETPAPGDGVVLVMRDQSGFRGTWFFVEKPAYCPKGRPNERVVGETPCPHCGEYMMHRLVAPKSPPPGRVVARGQCAQGAAGRMGGGEEYLLVVPFHTTFWYRRTGRLYGAPALVEVTVTPSGVKAEGWLQKQKAEEAAKVVW